MLILISIWIIVDLVLICSLCRIAARADQRQALLETQSLSRHRARDVG